MPSVRIGALAVAVLAIGCGVSNSDHQMVVAELEECRAAALRWETLYQESVEERRQTLDEALEMLPIAHDELRSQINLRLDEVTRSLDTTLRTEVQESVYELAEAIAQGYSVLQDENEQLEMQLAESRHLIESVLEKTDSIETRVGSEKEAFLAQRQALLLEIGEVEAFLRDWQYMHVDCKGCDERLRINKRERQALAELQEEILSRLAAVREKITAVG